MKTTVQTRLDEESQRAMTHLVRRLGWSPSKVVRESLRLLAACHREQAAGRIAGLGKFSSGIPDLGSNKSHLKRFGR